MALDLYEIRKLLNQGKTIYDIPLRVTSYSRVSSEKDEQIHSLKNQIEYYPRFIKSIPKWTYVEGYYDEGISGKSVNKRDDFLRMINDAQKGKFDLILTKEIARFARNTVDSISYTQKLLTCNVGVLFESDNINTFFQDSELRLTIMSSIAQDELRKLSERVKFGFRRSIEKGVVLGNDDIWGYKKDKGKLVIVEKEAEIVRTIFDLYANHSMGLRTLISNLEEKGIYNKNGNPFSMSTIRYIITNPKYKGYYCGNKTRKLDYRFNDMKILDSSEWVIYKDEISVPPIVSEELWNKANEKLKRRSTKNSNPNIRYDGRYTYSGKIVCGEHNVSYQRTVYKYKSGNKELWQCKKYKDMGKKACNAPSIYTYELDYIMKQVYNNLIKNKSEVIRKIMKFYENSGKEKKLANKIEMTKIEINDVLKKKDKLLSLLMKEIISENEFKNRNDEYNLKIKDLEDNIKQLNIEESKAKDISENIQVLRKMISNEIEFDKGFSSEIIEKILDKIIVNKTDNEDVFELDIYLRIVDKKCKAYLNKENGKINLNFSNNITSVCSEVGI